MQKDKTFTIHPKASTIILPELKSDTQSTGRTYITPDNNRYPSITTVLKVLSEDGIRAWKDRVGNDEAKKIITQASFRGTQVHDTAERYLNNDPEWRNGAMPVNLYTFMQMKPVLDQRVDNIWAQEVPLFSDRLQIAGRVDLIADLDGVMTVIDFKTARKPKKDEWITGYKLQASFYAAAFYERTGIAIKQFAILIAPDDSPTQLFTGNTFDNIEQLIRIREIYRDQYGL